MVNGHRPPMSWDERQQRCSKYPERCFERRHRTMGRKKKNDRGESSSCFVLVLLCQRDTEKRVVLETVLCKPFLFKCGSNSCNKT